ncbi:RING/U-box superfamily protein [Actinidia rufa]|uniref:RING/U-box superfamily protein n=1 Tax=Actinidia rufa TaxID=165716 RepID=A0A7J0EVQ8_9ERIC|nr:RING/U-box superfamily protein [Actinidia rufa]
MVMVINLKLDEKIQCTVIYGSDGEFSSTAYRDLLGQHTLFAEHTALSSATHPCPYIAYLGPIHPSSSNSGGSVSDGSTFSNHWNGPSVPREMPSSFVFPAMDVHYQGWEHHSSPFPTSSSRVGGADQPSVPSVTHRAARSNPDIQRSGFFMHPFLVGHRKRNSSKIVVVTSPSIDLLFPCANIADGRLCLLQFAARVGSSVASSMIPPYPSSVARARDRVQALQAYFHQPSNSRTPLIPAARRSTAHRPIAQVGPVASFSDQTGGFYFFPSASSGRNFQEAENTPTNRFQAWERDHLTSFPLSQADRDPGWGAFHQAAGGSDTAIRPTSFRRGTDLRGRHHKIGHRLDYSVFQEEKP